MSGPLNPFATTCSNEGRDDYWTCPACYADIERAGSTGQYTCASCGAEVICTIEYQPVCTATLVELAKLENRADVTFDGRGVPARGAIAAAEGRGAKVRGVQHA